MRKYIPAIATFLVGQGVAAVLAHFERTTIALVVSILFIIVGIAGLLWGLKTNRAKSHTAITVDSIERDINRTMQLKMLGEFAINIVIVVLISVVALNYIQRQDSSLVSREAQNLVIRVTSISATGMTPYGLLLEFGAKWDDIDPIQISANISGARVDATYAWWDVPSLKILTPQSVDFRKGVMTDALLGRSNVSPPIFTYYSFGKPLSATNSLYLWFVSPEPMTIEGAVFQGVHFHREKDKLVLDRR